MHPRVFLVLFLAGLIALPASLGLTSSAQAAGARGGDLYGAIAVDPSDGTYGYSYDYATRERAESRALRECRVRSDTTRCRGIVWVRNGCAAVAVRRRADDSLSRIRWGIGHSKRIAKHRALAKCGRRCTVLAFVCTTR